MGLIPQGIYTEVEPLSHKAGTLAAGFDFAKLLCDVVDVNICFYHAPYSHQLLRSEESFANQIEVEWYLMVTLSCISPNWRN